MDWLSGILNSGLFWMVVAVVLPVVLPNKTVYCFFHATVGRPIKAFTVKKQEAHGKGKAFFAYLLNTVAVALEAIVDCIRGEHKYRDKKTP